MSVLARKISKPSFWADFEDQDHWKGGNFAFPVLNELREGFVGESGLSCYELRSKNDPLLRRLAAALLLSATEKSISGTEFRFVSFERLKSLGIDLNQTDGNLKLLTDLNNRHYDILNLSEVLRGTATLFIAAGTGPKMARFLNER